MPPYFAFAFDVLCVFNPMFFLALGRGAEQGRDAARLTACGGALAQGVVVSLGLFGCWLPFAGHNKWIFHAGQMGVVAWLAWGATQMLLDARAVDAKQASEVDGPSRSVIVLQSFVSGVLNPWSWVWFAHLCAIWISWQDGALAARVKVVGLGVWLGAWLFAWHIGVGWLGARLGELLAERRVLGAPANRVAGAWLVLVAAIVLAMSRVFLLILD